MLRVPCQQRQRVWKQRQQNLKSLLSPRRTSGKVYDQRTPKDACDTAPERCKWRLLKTAETNLLRNPRNQPLAHGKGRLGRDIALAKSSASRGEHEIRVPRSVTQS